MSFESPVADDAPASADEPSRAVPQSAAAVFRQSVRYRDARIELILEPGGLLRRFVVLSTEKLRVALGQPRRREIEPLTAQQKDFRLRTSELFALGKHQARASLRLLYARLAESGDASTPALPKRRSSAKPLGQIEVAEPAEESVRGELLFAGKTDDGLFCLELLEDRRRVRSIKGLDLARALEVAEARIGDTICVERDGHHELAIREERSGSHGEGERTVRRGRETFRITKERASQSDSGVESINRSQRSVSSAS